MLEPTTLRAGAFAIAVMLAMAQTSPAAAQRLFGDDALEAFESESVRPSDPAAAKKLEVDPRTGNFTASNVSLAELVAFAYGVRMDQIVGMPPWAEAPRYRVEGRAPKEFAGREARQLVEDVRPLVAGLLVDFFSLEAHRSQQPIYYVLGQVAGGTLLRASADQRAAPRVVAQNDTGLAGQDVRIASFVMALEPWVGRPVLNQTALYGLYDVDFRRNASERNQQKLAAEIERQLGLTLRVVQYELLIVDHATELVSGGT